MGSLKDQGLPSELSETLQPLRSIMLLQLGFSSSLNPLDVSHGQGLFLNYLRVFSPGTKYGLAQRSLGGREPGRRDERKTASPHI